MKNKKSFLFLFSLLLCNGLLAGDLIPTLKLRIREMDLNPFYKTELLHQQATEISNKGNTNDLTLRELYGKTFQKDAEIEQMISTMSADGTWPDIDYKDSKKGNWSAAQHGEKLLYMCKAYRKKESRFYLSKDLSDKIHSGINAWARLKPVCVNWWFNQIGVPKVLGLVYLYMEDELSPEELAGAIEVMSKAGFRQTGQNKVWQAGNVLIRALLQNDEKLAVRARDSIASEVFVTTEEGIQPDYSFHQHGPQPQFGNYGLAYISSMAYYANLFENTEIAFNKKQIEILRHYAINGIMLTTWKGYMDHNACGRQLFKEAQRGKTMGLCVAIDQLKKADPEYKSVYQDFITRNVFPGSLPEYAVNKHFYRSDYSVYRGGDYFICVRSCSPRVIGTEFTNNENKKGHFIADGSTLFMRRGDEYRNIIPFWDWNRLPGVTAPLLDVIKPQPKDNYKNKNAFVGGLHSPVGGISVFHLNRNNVTARKSWFYLENSLVCLGAGIQTNCGKEIVTGINQCLQNGNCAVETSGVGSFASTDTTANVGKVNFVWHDSIGYLFPKPTDVMLSLKTQSGDWNDITDSAPRELRSGKVFKIWLNHGKNATLSDSYNYTVVPGVSKSDLIRLQKNPLAITMVNDTNMQAVSNKAGTICQIVFWKAGSLKTKTSKVTTDNGGLMMIEQQKKGIIRITLSDPTQKLKTYSFSISGKYTSQQANCRTDKKETVVTVDLPAKASAGQSVSIELKEIR